MKCNWQKLVTEVISALSENEKAESIAYIEQRVIPAGEELSWPGITRSFDVPVVLVFVDLQPQLNWTHQARYYVLDTNGNINQIIEVDRPPFLTDVSPHLYLVHRGSQAPEWAVMAPLMDTDSQVENSSSK